MKLPLAVAGAAGSRSASLHAPAVASPRPIRRRPVRVVVPYPPGGGIDIIGAHRRGRAHQAPRPAGRSSTTGPAASTVIGAEIVAKAPPDGYTLLVTSHTTFAFIPNLRSKLPYDPIARFRAGLAARDPAVRARRASVAAREDGEGADRARESEARRAHVSRRRASAPATHLSGELLQDRWPASTSATSRTKAAVPRVERSRRRPRLDGFRQHRLDAAFREAGEAPDLIAITSAKRSPPRPTCRRSARR